MGQHRLNLLNNSRPDPSQALTFLEHWFKFVDPESLISIIRIHPGNPKVRSLVLTRETVIGAIKSSGLDDLIWDGDLFFDLYYGVSTLKEKPEEGRRGGLKNVQEVPGVWLDLDVKSGAFESEADALALLDRLPLAPTAIVSTGLGGLHGYWRLKKPVSCETGKQLALQWWAMALNRAGDSFIDKLQDPSRVLRLPGAVRWPKTTDSGVPVVSRSELLRCEDTAYTVKEIEEASSWEWDAYERKRKETLTTKRNDLALDKYFKELNLDMSNKWTMALNRESIAERFAEIYSWDSILLNKGWTKLREDSDGRVFWSRPGDGVRKSATTDWPESPDVMSLFSTSPETGLADVAAAGLVLTKYFVWVQLYCGGDEVKAIDFLLKNMPEAFGH